jgi:hypothetical protein
MTEHVAGWSFLVARGRRLGHRTVLAPDFLTELNLEDVLSHASNGDGLAAGTIRTTEIESPAVGPMTLSFRTELLTPADLGENSTRAAARTTDEYGRRLEMLYGVVTRMPLAAPLNGEDMRAARLEAVRSYRRFLKDEDAFDVDASSAFATSAVPGPKRPALVSERPTRRATDDRVRPDPSPAGMRQPHRRVTRSRALLIRLAVALAALVVLTVWLLRPSAPAVNVTIRDARVAPQAGPVDCSEPVSFTLSARLTASRAATVRYHWESALGNTDSRTLHLRERHDVLTRTPFDANLRGHSAGTFVLKLDRRGAPDQTVSYDVTCSALAEVRN